MNSRFVCCITALLLLFSNTAIATIYVQVGYNQQVYQNGDVAFVDCSNTIIPVYIREEGTPWPEVSWSASANFSYSPIFHHDIALTLDSNRENGYITANFNGTFVTVYIIQKPTPTITVSPTLCSPGQSGTYAATLNYYGTNSANVVWETSGGITVNGSNYYRVIDNTISSATIQHNYSGFVTVYGEIPSCNNIRTHPVKLFIGKPKVDHFTVNGQTLSNVPAMCLGYSQDIFKLML